MDTGLEKPLDPLISPQPFSLQLEKQFIYFVFLVFFFFSKVHNPPTSPFLGGDFLHLGTKRMVVQG